MRLDRMRRCLDNPTFARFRRFRGQGSRF
jgi:hypothetical protein